MTAAADRKEQLHQIANGLDALAVLLQGLDAPSTVTLLTQYGSTLRSLTTPPVEWDEVPDTDAPAAPAGPTPAMDAWDEVTLYPGQVRELVMALGVASVILDETGFTRSAERLRALYWGISAASLGAPRDLPGTRTKAGQ